MAKQTNMFAVLIVAVLAISLFSVYIADKSSGGTPSTLAIAGSVADGSNVNIDLLNAPICMEPRQTSDIAVRFTNPTDSPITFNSELGIYRRDFLEYWQLLSIGGTISAVDQKSCGSSDIFSSESFVNSKSITISPHATQWINFTVSAPHTKDAWGLYQTESVFGKNAGDKWANQPNWLGYGNNYEVLVGTYKECGSGYWSFQREHLDIEQDCANPCQGAGCNPPKDTCEWYETKGLSFWGIIFGIPLINQTCKLNYMMIGFIALIVLAGLWIVLKSRRPIIYGK
jgi:hypothetical protein